MIEIVGRLGPAPVHRPDRMMTAHEAMREQTKRFKFAAWIAAGRPGSGRKKRIVRRAKRRAR